MLCCPIDRLGAASLCPPTILTQTQPCTPPRLGKDLAPLSRSLPEVLHHLDAIVTILTTRLREPWGPAHEHALLLVAALAKVRREHQRDMD